MNTHYQTFLTCFLSIISVSLTEREHKVHNIVLYPEKHSWCKTTKIEQIVTMPGYEPMTIENNVCVGACYSYSIPRTQPAEPGELIGPYCDSCQPAKSDCYHVTLKADNKNSGPPTAKKYVQIITNCSCQSCSKMQETDCEVLEEKTSELPSDLFSTPIDGNFTLLNSTVKHKISEDVPELLNIDQLNVTSPNLEPLNEDVNAVLRKKLIQSLSVTIKNFDLTTIDDLKKEQVLKQLIFALEDGKNKFSDDNLLALFTSASTEHVDLKKIKDILFIVKEQRELLEKHRNFGILGNFVPIINDNNNNKIKQSENFGGLKNLNLYKGGHLGLGIQQQSVETNFIPESSHKHHHYIGEVIQNVGVNPGHLSKGPHGSLVVVPQVKVKKNEEGLIMQYE
ncbi:uncharacterized protein [Onthophagus taurus]|uniref:uncharacterized protein n=1 Tax=Onthophagus taurus TaxID=166361 RepID=UPI000C202708|nr:uncharacterized protein LOC111414132 [Onthophagus taurus]